MTGARILNLIITLYWITSVLLFASTVLEFLDEFVLRRVATQLAWTAWWGGTAFFLMLGSDYARKNAIFLGVQGMVIPIAIYLGLRDVYGPTFVLFIPCLFLSVAYAFSFWALWFYRPLRKALRQKLNLDAEVAARMEMLKLKNGSDENP